MEPRSRKEADPLCGWIGSDDTEQQVQLRFPSKEAAIAYARRQGIEFRVHEPHERVVRPNPMPTTSSARCSLPVPTSPDGTDGQPGGRRERPWLSWMRDLITLTHVVFGVAEASIFVLELERDSSYVGDFIPMYTGSSRSL